MSGYKYASCLGNFANVFTKSEMVAYTRYVLVPVDSLAERTELTPSRLSVDNYLQADCKSRRNAEVSRDGAGHFHQPLLSLSPTKNVNYTVFVLNIFAEIIIDMAWVCGFLM